MATRILILLAITTTLGGCGLPPAPRTTRERAYVAPTMEDLIIRCPGQPPRLALGAFGLRGKGCQKP